MSKRSDQYHNTQDITHAKIHPNSNISVSSENDMSIHYSEKPTTQVNIENFLKKPELDGVMNNDPVIMNLKTNSIKGYNTSYVDSDVNTSLRNSNFTDSLETNAFNNTGVNKNDNFNNPNISFLHNGSINTDKRNAVLLNNESYNV